MMGYITLRPTCSISTIPKLIKRAKASTLTIGASPDPLICHVHALIDLLSTRASLPSLLFSYRNGLPLTRQFVTSQLRTLLAACSIPQSADYAIHSFRIVVATSAAIAQVLKHLVRHMGRWRSSAILRYIQVQTEEAISVSACLAAVQ